MLYDVTKLFFGLLFGSFITFLGLFLISAIRDACRLFKGIYREPMRVRWRRVRAIPWVLQTTRTDLSLSTGKHSYFAVFFTWRSNLRLFLQNEQLDRLDKRRGRHSQPQIKREKLKQLV